MSEAPPDPSAPLYYAHRMQDDRGDRGVYYMSASTHRKFVELHYYDAPIVRVRLRERGTEDPPANAWGWLAANEPEHYIFVWPSRVQRDMCFPYGPAAEEALGRGRRVDLILEEVPPDPTTPPECT